MLDFRGAAAAAVLLAGWARLAQTQDIMRPSQPQIVTTGQGEVRVIPDRATVSIGVQTRAATAAEASSTNSRKQKAVIDAIRTKGTPADQIATTGFSVQPEMRYSAVGAPVVTGYLVSNVVTVQLQRTDLVGAVIDTSIAAGANQIQSLTFTISNPDSSRRAALAIAVTRAKGDAEAAARAAGGALGAMIELTASEYEAPVYRAAVMQERAGPAMAATPVEAGTQPVRASVTGRWQFLQTPPR
jgi:uncharacterized protein YggE